MYNRANKGRYKKNVVGETQTVETVALKEIMWREIL